MSATARLNRFLAELAPQSAEAWTALGSELFPGELSIATATSVYRFKDGRFLGRARNGARSFEYAQEMRGKRLIGFLHDEGGLHSLTPRWREGGHALLWKPGATEIEAFVVTSPTLSFTIEEPHPQPRPDPSEPVPSPWVRSKTRAPAPSHSGVMIRRIARPPSIRQPLPPSMTRIHSAPALPELPILR